MLLSSTPITALANTMKTEKNVASEVVSTNDGNPQEQRMGLSVNESAQELLGDFTVQKLNWTRFGVNGRLEYRVLSDNAVFEDDYWMSIEQYNSQGELLSSTPQYIYFPYSDLVNAETSQIDEVLFEETTKIRFAAVENREQNIVYYSDYYNRAAAAMPTFTYDSVQTGINDVSFFINSNSKAIIDEDYGDVSKEPIYCKVTLSKGGVLQEVEEYNINMLYPADHWVINVDELLEATTYSASVELYVENYDGVKIFSKVINIPAFTTKTDTTYTFNQIIPDEALRRHITDTIWGSNEPLPSTVTQSKLDQISSIYVDGYDSSIPIQSIQGIDYLSNMEYLTINNNLITSLNNINWSKLTKLEYLSLEGNAISTDADFSGLTQTGDIFLDSNLLSEASIRAIRSTIPDGWTISLNNQRTNGLSIIAEDIYYEVGGKTPVFVILKGVNLNNNPAITFKIDGQVAGFERVYEYMNNEWKIIDAGLDDGTHTLEVTVANETKTVSFVTAAEQSVFFDKQIVNSDEESVGLELNSMQGVDLSFDEIRLVSKSNPNVSIADLRDHYDSQMDSDPRYTTIGEGGDYYLNNAYTIHYDYYYFDILLKTIPIGEYNLQFIKDNQVVVIEDVLEVVDNKPILNEVYSTSGYDQTGNSLYVRLNGSRLDPSKLQYEVKEDSLNLPVSYVSNKKTYDGYIVKLKRENWSFIKNETLDIKISAIDGYEVFMNNNRCSIYPQKGIYYSELDYNNSILELAYANDVSPQKIKVIIEQLDDSSNAVEIATGETSSMQDGFVRIPLTDQGGNVPKYEYGVYQYKIFFDNIQVALIRDYTGTYYSSDNVDESWNIDSYTMVGSEKISFVYQSNLSYDEYTLNKDKYSIQLTNEKDESIRELSFEDYNNDGFVNLYGTIDSTNLAIGTYKVTLLKDETVLSSKLFEIISNGKFLLDYSQVSWINDTTMQFYMGTPNVTDLDEFNVELIDPKGNPVTGLTTTMDKKYSSVAYLNVTGLNRSTAYRKYWVKVTHKTLGAPLEYDQVTPYYSDIKGKYMEIYDYSSTASYITNKKRTIGIYNYGMKLPITINAYIPYDTGVVASMAATKEVEQRIYFTSTFINALPNKDRLYDLVVRDADGKTVVFERKSLGLEDSLVKPVPLTAISVSPKTLQLEPLQSESLNVSYTPANATDSSTVTWQSSNSNVATVNSSGTVTAVARGNATITATCGRFTAICKVTVLEKVSNPLATPSTEDSAIEKNTSVTLSCATPNATIYYTVNGSDPTTSSSIYKTPIVLTKDTTIKTKAVKSGYISSDIITYEYQIKTYTITFDSNGGTPQNENQVLRKGEYLDASMIDRPVMYGYRFVGWYADDEELDLLKPIDSNKVYEARWEEAETLTIPIANYPSNKELLDGAVIKLFTQEPDTTIYYTLDGTTPSENSTLYKGQITLKKTIEGDQPLTIKAISTKDDYKNSEVATCTYILKEQSDELGEIKPEDIPEGSMEPNLWVAGLKNSYIYTGSYIKPSVRVYDENRLLTLNKDYTLTYKNAKYAGTASLTITGKGNYYSSKTYFYAIQPKPLTQDDITAVNPILFANGKVQKLIPSVKDRTKKLSYNKDGKKDFTVSYEADPVDGEPAYKVPGKYKITINGTNNYTGSIDVVETILDKKTQYLISKSSVAKIPTQIFTGDDITPAITVKYGKTPLVLNEDYKLTYLNNMAVGTATILIQGMGDYHGTKQVSFRIQGKDMRYVKVTSGWVGSFPYEAGKTSYEQENLVLGYQKSTKVPVEEVPTQAYTVYYVKNQGVGIATAIFTGNPAYGYSGTMKKIFKISPNLDFTNAEITYDDEVTYLKGGCYPSVSVSLNDVTLVAGKDYTVSYTYNKAVCLDPTVKYAPTITVKGKGNYKGSKQVKFTITQASLADLTMVASDRVFTGKANAFATSVSIYDTNGKALVADRDYGKALTYWVNGVQLTKTDVVADGATVVVRATGKNSYTGTLETSFRVIKKENLLPYAKATIPNQVYTGSPITLQKSDITVTVKQGLQTVTLTSNDFEIVGYSKNTAKGTATVILKGVGTYGGIKKVTFKITAREVINYII